LDLDTLERCPTWLGRRIQAAVDAREAAEWRRLFYVAATRAKTRLILVGEHPVRKDGGLTTADTWRRAVEEVLSSRPDLVRRVTWDDLAALPEPGEAPPDAPATVPAAADAAIARLRWRPPLPTRFVL